MLHVQLTNKLRATECKSWSRCQLQRLQTFMNHNATCLDTAQSLTVSNITLNEATIFHIDIIAHYRETDQAYQSGP